MKFMRRNETLHIRKRVPRRYRSVEEREFFWVSLHTDSEAVARQKAPIIWAEMIEAWEATPAGDTSDADSRIAVAKNLAAKRGYRYLPVASVAQLPRPAQRGRNADGGPDPAGWAGSIYPDRASRSPA